MDFDLPPAPGEFVPPAAAPRRPEPVVATQALALASDPSFSQIQQQMLEQQIQQQIQQQAAMGQPLMRAMGEAPVAPAAPTPDTSSLGVVLLAVAAGSVLGGMFAGGAVGAVGGALVGAAAANAFKAVRGVTQGDEASDREAVTNGTYALGGAAIGIYLLYKARSGETLIPNLSGKKDEDEDGPSDEGAEEGSDEAKIDRPLLGPARGVKITQLGGKKLSSKKGSK